MGLRAVAALVLCLALAAPARAETTAPPPGERTSFVLAGTFAFCIEHLSFGFRVHPRLAVRIWRDHSPPPASRPTHGTLEVGLFGGWSNQPIAIIQAQMMSAGGTLEGSGGHWGLLLASFGSTAHTETRRGHDAQIGLHLLGGWASRHDRAHVVVEQHGIDANYEETAHAVVGGFVLSPAVLFDGRAGPVFEASFFPLATHRALAHWHVGLGLAVRLGPDPEQD